MMRAQAEVSDVELRQIPGDTRVGRPERLQVDRRAEMPPRVCLNEIVISPTWNRLWLGGEDIPARP